MARKAASIEYLERLVAWAGGRAAFQDLTKIASPNVTAYLRGDKSISWKRLKSCTEQVFGVPPAFVPVLEGYNFCNKGFPTLADLPKCDGIYCLYDSAMRAIYYGKASNLYAEVRQTLGRRLTEVRPWTPNSKLKFSDITKYISAYRISRGDADFRHDVEALCHRLFVNNTFNQNGGKFQRNA